jgi:hypothetical protein
MENLVIALVADDQGGILHGGAISDLEPSARVRIGRLLVADHQLGCKGTARSGRHRVHGASRIDGRVYRVEKARQCGRGRECDELHASASIRTKKHKNWPFHDHFVKTADSKLQRGEAFYFCFTAANNTNISPIGVMGGGAENWI